MSDYPNKPQQPQPQSSPNSGLDSLGIGKNFDNQKAMQAALALKEAEAAKQAATGKQPTVDSPTVPIEPHAVKSATLRKSPSAVTFYSRLDGAPYYFADGGVAVFTGGIFEFDPKNPDEDYSVPEGKGTAQEGWDKRFKELQYVCKVANPVFSAVPVEVQRSDSQVLREVGHAGGGTASGTGIVGSTQLAGLFQQGAR